MQSRHFKEALKQFFSLSLEDARIEFCFAEAKNELRLTFEGAYSVNDRCYVDGVARFVGGDILVDPEIAGVPRSDRPLGFIWDMDVICDVVILSGPDPDYVHTFWTVVDPTQVSVELTRPRWRDETGHQLVPVEFASEPAFDRVIVATGNYFSPELRDLYRALCLADAEERGEHPLPVDPLSWTKVKPRKFVDGDGVDVQRWLDQCDAVVFYSDLGGYAESIRMCTTGARVVCRRIMGADQSREFVRSNGFSEQIDD